MEIKTNPNYIRVWPHTKWNVAACILAHTMPNWGRGYKAHTQGLTYDPKSSILDLKSGPLFNKLGLHDPTFAHCEIIRHRQPIVSFLHTLTWGHHLGASPCNAFFKSSLQEVKRVLKSRFSLFGQRPRRGRWPMLSHIGEISPFSPPSVPPPSLSVHPLWGSNLSLEAQISPLRPKSQPWGPNPSQILASRPKF